MTGLRHPQRIPCCGALLAALAAPPATAAGRLADASDILRRAEAVRSPELDYAADFRLDVLDPGSSWKERSATYTMIAQGKDHSLVLMREPELYPGLLLITEGAYWMLLPYSDKPLQLAARNVLNGDIANSDLARGNLLRSYAPRLDGEEEVERRTCYRLELKRTQSMGLYERIVSWIDVDNFRPLKFQYYGQSRTLLKTAHYRDWRRGALGVRAMRIEVQSDLRPGERTILTFTNLRRFPSTKLSFTVEGLPAIRDAALAVRDRRGRQAQPEDLLPGREAVGP